MWGRSFAYCNRLGLLPVVEEVRGAVLHGFVLLDDLHLQVGHLLLDSGVFALHDVAERAPFAFDVVDVEPGWRELEALLLQQSLPVTEQLRWSARVRRRHANARGTPRYAE